MVFVNREAVEKVIADIMSDCKVTHKHRALNRNIKQIPTADVVEVVRCKDCGVKGSAFCMAGDFPLTKENENDFCSYGKRK